GPFKTSTGAMAGAAYDYSVSLSPLDADHAVIDLSAEEFQQSAKAGLLRVVVEVSLSDVSRDRTTHTREITYQLLTGASYSKLRACETRKIVTQSDSAVIARAARQLLVRRRPQQLTALLPELADRLENAPAATPEGRDTLGVVQSAIRLIETDEAQAQR